MQTNISPQIEMNRMNDPESRTLKTVEITFEVIDALKDLEKAGVTEIANYLDISKGATYNHLATLRGGGYVVKSGDEYMLGYRFMNIGKFVQNRSLLYAIGKQHLDNLAAETGEYAHLMVEQDGLGYYLYRSKGENAIAEEYHEKKSEDPDYLHYGSPGKAILAELPRERVDEIIDEHGLPKSTENTITSREALYEELEQTRERGYAIYDEEEVMGIRAVGTAITDRQSHVYGAISVCGPLTRIQGEVMEDELPKRVQRTANLIEIDLQTTLNGDTDSDFYTNPTP